MENSNVKRGAGKKVTEVGRTAGEQGAARLELAGFLPESIALPAAMSKETRQFVTTLSGSLDGQPAEIERRASLDSDRPRFFASVAGTRKELEGDELSALSGALVTWLDGARSRGEHLGHTVSTFEHGEVQKFLYQSMQEFQVDLGLARTSKT